MATTSNGSMIVSMGTSGSGASLSAATTGGTGGALDLGVTCTNAVMVCKSSAALSVTTDLVVLEGSMNNSDFYVLAQSGAINTDFASAARTRAYGSVAPYRPFRYLRVTIGTVTLDTATA